MIHRFPVTIGWVKRNNKVKKVIEYEHGIGIEPASKAIIGSQQVPFIYEDRVNGKDVSTAIMKMYEYGKEKREALGSQAREHVMNNYSFEKFSNNNEYGSWEERKNYKSWELIEA